MVKAMALLAAGGVLASLACLARTAGEPERPAGGASASTAALPAELAAREVELRGEICCLAEEMARLHAVPIPPVHEHLLGLRADDGTYLTLLRTPAAAGLFHDPRFRGKTLVLAGRTFPRTGLLEARRTGWVKGGKVFDVYYWCEVCAIRSANPGPCACCQGSVDLLERAEGGPAISPEPKESGTGPGSGPGKR